MTEDMDYPHLTPRGDRLPSGNKLFRRAGELSDDQFDLLAAAWAGDALDGDALAEMEEVMSANPGKRDRAESFHRLHLTPVNETWPSGRSFLRPSPIRVAFRRTILPALMAAAAMMALIILGPAGARLKTTISTKSTPGPVAMTTAEIPASHPIIAEQKRYEPRAGTPAGSEDRVPADFPDEILSAAVEPVRAMPLALGYGQAGLSTVATPAVAGISTLSIKEISPSLVMQEEKNWMLRSISFLASAVTGKDKEIDGYMIANGCITGINSILGWEMDLEQVSNKSGEPIAVSFSSSLLSFTKPVNKTTP